MQKVGNVTDTADQNGEFTDGNVAQGVPPTILNAAIFNTWQRELVNVVEGADLTLDPMDFHQVLKAIQSIVTQSYAEAYKNTYPVGIVTWFAQNKNPNTLFPGTQWVYIGENKTVRLADSDGSDILQTGGNDTVTLSAGNLPAHNHTFSAQSGSFDHGSKSGNTNNAGQHFHAITGDATDTEAGSPVGLLNLDGRLGVTGSTHGGRASLTTFGDGTQIILNAGEHSHSFSVAVGSHSHSVSGSTGNVGSGDSVNITNAYVKLMGWYRNF